MGINELDINLIEKQSHKLAGEIKEHVKECEFCGVHHFVGKPYSIKMFFENFRIKDQEKEEKVHNIPKELEWYAKLISTASFARTHMAETSGYLQNKIRPTLLEVDKKLNLAQGDHIWLSFNEIIRGLENPSQFKIHDIGLRKEKVGVFSERDREVIASGSDVVHILDKLLDKKTYAEYPLKGRVASKGKVRGTAKIVVRPDDIDKVEEGDILIAPETTPDFVPGMRKAAGIITNRGGITSHAAIVSREFGIPCVVGVKDATSIIKDGHDIELDAIKGRVNRII